MKELNSVLIEGIVGEPYYQEYGGSEVMEFVLRNKIGKEENPMLVRVMDMSLQKRLTSLKAGRGVRVVGQIISWEIAITKFVFRIEAYHVEVKP